MVRAYAKVKGTASCFDRAQSFNTLLLILSGAHVSSVKTSFLSQSEQLSSKLSLSHLMPAVRPAC